MRKLFLLTYSDHDIGNAYLAAFSKLLEPEAVAHGWSVEKAVGAENTQKNVMARLKRHPDFCAFNGHGNENELYGHFNEIVLKPSDAAGLAGSVAFIRACGCLAGLGKAAVKAGAKGVVGYRGDFWIPRVNEYASTPLKDPPARLVLEASNAVALKLLKGGSASEAVEAGRAKAREAILRILTREEPYDVPALKSLVNNDALLDFEGDAGAKPGQY